MSGSVRAVPDPPDIAGKQPSKTKVERAESVTQAARSGSQKDLLVAMRDRIAKAVQDEATPARDLAALSRRLMEIAKELKSIEAQEAEEDAGIAAADDEEFDPAAI